MSLPKVLVISQPFNNDTGGGITLSNLFLGWDRDKIAVICTGHLLEYNIDTSICNRYYQLGDKEQSWMFPLNLLKRKYASGPIQFDERKIQNLTIPKSKLRVKLIMKYLFPFLKFTGIMHIVKKTQLSEELLRWLNEFKPDIIYAQAEHLDRMNFCLIIQNYLKKPMVFHMMDDWPSLITDKGLFKSYWKRKIEKQLTALLKKSDLLMSICDEMSEEYEKRYKEDFIAFHNPVDLQFWQQHQKKDYSISQAPKILYAGRIGIGIDKSVQQIAKSIDKINQEMKCKAQLILQTEERPAWTDNYKCVQYQSLVPYEQLPEIFSKADLLVLPYDFTDKSLKFIRYSMPTKFSEYMISGTPVLIFAPKETAVVKYAQRFSCAKIVTKNTSAAVAVGIKSLIQNENERTLIAKNAIRVAETNHNAVKIRNRFKQSICSLV